MESTAAPPTAGLRSLNTTFVRKGIVASTTGSECRDLPSEVLTLVARLKSECQGVCENVRDVGSFIQLWKERSLHQTFQALDSSNTSTSADDGAGSASNREKQIQAIEMHEKAGQEINEMLQWHRAEITRDVYSRIDNFTDQLAMVLTELIKPELEEELEREKAIVHRLVQEKQRLDQVQQSLQQMNQELGTRIESLENAPNGGGDAILCNKLRDKVRELTSYKRKLLESVASMEKEREQHRWDMLQIKKELELQQRTFLMTKAMHEKETKQLVELVHNRQAQFAHVMQAPCNGEPGTATTSTMYLSRVDTQKQHQQRPLQLANLKVYDPVSGHTIQYASKSPQKMPRSPSTTSSDSSKLGFAFTASPLASPKRKLLVPPPNPSLHPNPNQQQQRRSLDLGQVLQQQQQRRQEEEMSSLNLSTAEASGVAARSEQLPPPCNTPLESPSGHVRRFMNPQSQAKS